MRRIDGLASFSSDGCLPWLMQQALGIDHLRWASMVWGGGGTGSCGALAHATAAVESGQADTVLVLRSMVQRPGGRYGEAGGFSEMPQFDLLAPFGMLMPSSMFAPSARRYMHDFHVPTEAFAEVALNARANAQRNPRAVMHGQPLTLADYLASRMIADPLRLLDCCQESDGACAVIVTTQERARDLKGVPVRVLAAAQGGDAGWNAATMGTHNMPPGDYGGGNAAQLARDLYGRAGVGPADIAVAQIYDHFSPAVLWTLENFGFCGRGEAGAFVLDGQIRPERPPAGEHRRRHAVGSLHSRREPDDRGGAPIARHVDHAKWPAPEPASSPAAWAPRPPAPRSWQFDDAQLTCRPWISAAPALVEHLAFWRHCAQGELRFQRCEDCGARRHPPSPLCPMCRSVSSRWELASGDAELFSYTVVHHAASAALQHAVPYNIAIVAFPSLGMLAPGQQRHRRRAGSTAHRHGAGTGVAARRCAPAAAIVQAGTSR